MYYITLVTRYAYSQESMLSVLRTGGNSNISSERRREGGKQTLPLSTTTQHIEYDTFAQCVVFLCRVEKFMKHGIQFQ